MRIIHSVFEAQSIGDLDLEDSLVLDGFLRHVSNLVGSNIMDGPTISIRKTAHRGSTGMVILEHGHIVVHIFSNTREIRMDVLSFGQFNTSAITNFIIDYFNISPKSLRIMDVGCKAEESFECEESRCTAKATRIWEGRRVCQDHYDSYRDKYNDKIQDDFYRY